VNLFDTHVHLNDANFNDDREEVIRRAGAAGVAYLINVGISLESSLESIRLAEKYDFIYAAIGIHPHNAVDAGPGYLERLEKLAAHPRVVALGEMGLDYYRDLSPRPVQQELFREQLKLAKKLRLPVIIHDREAHGDILDILRREGAGLPGGVLHCFSGSWEMAAECLAMGLYISIAGPVTFPKAPRLKDIAGRIPPERLLVETDAPYLTPVPYRGKRNEPARVAYVVEEIARIRGVDKEMLAKKCTDNGKRLFQIT